MTPALLFLLLAPLAGAGDDTRILTLLDGSPENFASHWLAKDLRRPLTRYEVVDDDGNSVLMARSDGSASAVWRRLSPEPFAAATLSWRWRIERSLAGAHDERKKAGDDHAARVYVFFGAKPFSRRTRGICYVWAGNEAVGSSFPSPYSKRIITVVVRSGDDGTGRWSLEERDLVADYRRVFGGQPAGVFAVGVLVDSDNTDRAATAWFDDIALHFGAPGEAAAATLTRRDVP